MSKDLYNKEFYNKTSAQTSAREIIPIIIEFINPTSVVDVGCGAGEFLMEFSERGVLDILGIDGTWANKETLKIPKENFLAFDLQQEIKLNRKFDLAISTEVAEHLPESTADIFIKSLTSLADTVAFSAAIPLQGGVHHVNEQWPQYWADKFKEYGFVAMDLIRPRIWNIESVQLWYKQNLIIYIKEENKLASSVLSGMQRKSNEVLPLVHPELFNFYARFYRKMMAFIPPPIKWILKKFIKNI